MRTFLIITTLLISQSIYAYDYIKHSGITTQEESCKMYREFNLEECRKQAATVKDYFKQPKCEMWHRQRERMLLDCDGKSPRAIAEKKAKQRAVNLQKNATHILVEKGRLVCRSEKNLRETYNSIINQEVGTPRHIRNKVCKVLDYETIVKIISLATDKKVAEIEYMDKYGSVRNGFTAELWLITKEQYKEVLKNRKGSEM